MAARLSTQRLVASRWAFGQVGKAFLTRGLALRDDGSIADYDHSNERRWLFDNGQLKILGEDGRTYWESEKISLVQGGFEIILRSTFVPETIFRLVECIPATETEPADNREALDTASFLFPDDLEVTPTGLQRVLFVGSCLTAHYYSCFNEHYPEVAADYIQFNFAGELPAAPPAPAEHYDFQYLQIPIRSVLSDRAITEIATASHGWSDAIYEHALFST